MLVVAIGSFAVFVVVVYLIIDPLRQRGGGGTATTSTSALFTQKERLLTDIRELDMDLATGKIDARDHERFRAAAMARAADTLQALDEEASRAAAGDAAEAEEVAAASERVDERLEELIAERKHAIEAHSCPSCASPVSAEDAFCRRCGLPLAALTVGVIDDAGA